MYGVLVDDAAPGTARSTNREVERAARELAKVADAITTVTRLTSGAVRDLFERL